MTTTHRIALIHALKDSQTPAWDAFAEVWPEAEIFNLLDDSLAADLATAGSLQPPMFERFATLSQYAAESMQGARKTAGILFTCSAFGPAIERVQQSLGIPVLRPNEAAFEAAVEAGSRIGLVVTFATALPPLTDELKQIAKQAGKTIEVSSVVAEGALQALKAGDAARHDEIVAKAAATLEDVDALVLCQFSLARAAKAIAPVPGRKVFTTPASAVAKLRQLIEVPSHPARP